MISSYFRLGNFYWRKDSQTLLQKSDVDDTFQGVSSLTKKQYDLLYCLVDAHPAVVDKDTIVAYVWKTKHISSESLPQLINRTRQVLGDHNKSILVNEPGIGYRLNFSTIEEANAPIEHASHEPIEKESVDEEKNVEDEAEAMVSRSGVPKLTKPWVMLITISLVVIMMFQLQLLYSSVHHKQIFDSIVTSVPYPYITKKDNQTIVTIDSHECIYHQDQQLLSCP